MKIIMLEEESVIVELGESQPKLVQQILLMSLKKLILDVL
jgi:hypothetical protein